MGSPPHEKLSRREREIMDVLYALAEGASAEDVRERLSDPPSYSAVRAMLAKLEAKGYARHREEGLRYVYTPRGSRAAAQRSALQKLVSVFFGGSPGQTVTALLKQENWTDDELDELRAEIDRDPQRSEAIMKSTMINAALALGDWVELSILVKVTLMLILGLCIARFAERAQASVRHLVLAVTLVSLGFIPLMTAVLPEVTIPRSYDPS